MAAERQAVYIIQEINRLNFPIDWINPVKQIADKKNFVLQNLNPKSLEFLAVQKLLIETIPAGVVKKVDIVQNIDLWVAYQGKLKVIKDKLGEDPET